MKSINLIFAVLLSIFFIINCSEKPELISPANKKLQYNGRIDFSDINKPMLTWAGSSVKVKFKGNGIKVQLQAKSPCYVNFVLDDDSVSVFQVDTLKKWYVLAANLDDTVHTVQFLKRTNNGDLWFYGFKPNDGTKLLELPKQDKIIEFIGDSITKGSSIHDTTGDNWRGLNSDNYYTYGAVTARYFNAAYYCIAQGGVGLLVGGNPLTMNDLYPRLNIRDADSRWDFSKVQPDIVVINLFQNDYYIIDKNPEHPHFVEKFGKKRPTDEYIIDAYVDFVKKVKKNYPNAKIICSIGSMDAAKEGSPWVGYVKSAVKKINNKDVYFCLFPYKNTPGHPKVKEHQVMADTLINFIKRNNLWQ